MPIVTPMEAITITNVNNLIINYMNQSCPNCKSNETVKKGRGCLIWFLALMFFPLGMLLLLIEPVKQCKNCKYTWK